MRGHRQGRQTSGFGDRFRLCSEEINSTVGFVCNSNNVTPRRSDAKTERCDGDRRLKHPSYMKYSLLEQHEAQESRSLGLLFYTM